jgi:hypothetical protein
MLNGYPLSIHELNKGGGLITCALATFNVQQRI